MRRRPHHALAPLIAAVFSLGTAFAPAQDPGAAVDEAVEKLVAQLVSPNSPLNPGNKPFRATVPHGYDRKAQERIEQVIVALQKAGTAAIPSLLKHRDDKRYCRSYSTSIMRDFSVGETCMEVLGALVGGRFEGRHGYKAMPDYGEDVISPDPEMWWKAHRTKSLPEMRIEALRWTIQAEKDRIAQGDEAYFELIQTSRQTWAKTVIPPLERLLAKAERDPEAIRFPIRTPPSPPR
ncbi:MAG: hypothetical protein R3F11_08070 [Verrucomicrobiales bacterium]